MKLDLRFGLGKVFVRSSILVAVALLSGCVSIYPKASKTLDCPSDRIDTAGGPPVRIASGCGKRDALFFDGAAWSS